MDGKVDGDAMVIGGAGRGLTGDMALQGVQDVPTAPGTRDAGGRTPPLPRRRRPRRRWIAAGIALGLLLALAIPGALTIATGMNDYNAIKALGLSGVRHILTAKTILTGQTAGSGASADSCAAPPAATATPSGLSGGASALLAGGIPTAEQVQAARGEFKAAGSDFAALQSRLNHPDWVMNAAGGFPGVAGKFTTARALAAAGSDVSAMGVEFLGAAEPILARLHDGALGTQALMTQNDLDAVQHATDDALTQLADVRAQLAHVNLDDLPICAAQKAEFTRLAGELPRAQDLLQQADGLIQPVGWFLGLDHPRRYLVQELDRDELRATGGFTGQFAVVTVSGGKVDPISMLGANSLDYGRWSNGYIAGDGGPNGRRPPAAYSWWPIPDWGFRDANLNADFPTDAKLVMSVFKQEATDPYFQSIGGGNTDGLVNFTPIAIAHVLKVTGPLYVPKYDETVTADNLEDRIHYYQLTTAGQEKNLALFPEDGAGYDHATALARARHEFLQNVAQLLEDRVRHLPAKDMAAVAKQALKDLAAREIQVYVNQPQLEAFLLQHHLAGAMDTTKGLDSLFVVHENWSAAKVNMRVQVAQRDDVALDDKGGATHHLTVTIANKPNGQPYYDSFTTYWDYVRVYVPQGAKLLGGDGFQQISQPICDKKCPATMYPGGELSCPPGAYYIEGLTTHIDGLGSPTLDQVGGPTQTTSDVAGKTMWGGDVTVPVNCTATLTLSWYVPNVAAPSSVVPAGYGPYTLLIERQGGTFYTAQVTIHPAQHVAADGTKTATYSATMDTDKTFTLGTGVRAFPADVGL